MISLCSFSSIYRVIRTPTIITKFYMSKAIPNRWLPYSCTGSVIEGTRLVCFKVPLRKTVLQNCIRNGMEIEEIWDIEALLKKLPKLRLVIDLTNTDRYYDPRMLEAAGVEHVKIALPGRIIPPENTVKLFCDTVERFLAKGDDDSLVGVHCTHGLNRTGYMVCRYLRDRMAMQPDKAIEIFEAARGYKIERDNYLAAVRGTEPPPPDFEQETTLKPLDEVAERKHGDVDRKQREREQRNYEDRRNGYKTRDDQDYRHNDRDNRSYGRNDRSYDRQRENWRGGNSRIDGYGRERSGNSYRERSPLRKERKRDEGAGWNTERKPQTRNRRFNRYSDSSGASDTDDFDYRYDY